MSATTTTAATTSTGIPLHLFFSTYNVHARCQVVVYVESGKKNTGPPLVVGQTEWITPTTPPPSVSPHGATEADSFNPALVTSFSVPVVVQYCFADSMKFILCVLFEGQPRFWETKIKLGKLVKLAFKQSRTGCAPHFLDLHEHLDSPLPIVQVTKKSGKVITVKQHPPLMPGKLLVRALELMSHIAPPGVSFIPPLVGDQLVIREVYTNPRWEYEFKVHLKVSASNLRAADRGGTSDPYFVWEEDTVIYKSEYIKKTLNPEWKKVDITGFPKHSGGIFRIYDHDTFKDDFLGSCLFPFDTPGLRSLPPGVTTKICPVTPTGTVTITIINRVLHRHLMAKGVESLQSHPIVTNSERTYLNIWHPVTFLQSLSLGLKISPWLVLDQVLVAALQSETRSIIGGYQYETCFRALGKVLKSYTSDDIIHMFVFGAWLWDKYTPVAGISKYDAACKKGVKGALKTYNQSLPVMCHMEMEKFDFGDVMWRAKNKHYIGHDFYQAINHACDVLELNVQGAPLNKLPQEYMVLCIFVAGDEFTIDYTHKAIIRASALPISIVLVGVGPERDFHHLSQLDSDTVPLTFTTPDGRTVKAARDIVQVVKLNDCMQGGKIKKKALRAQVLAEIPKQVESYLGLYGVSLT
ncbi:Copine VIII [Pelomyxa schiedti]|nr:Copine VIII [Pelomyxa schiedti]